MTTFKDQVDRLLSIDSVEVDQQPQGITMRAYLIWLLFCFGCSTTHPLIDASPCPLGDAGMSLEDVPMLDPVEDVPMLDQDAGAWEGDADVVEPSSAFRLLCDNAGKSYRFKTAQWGADEGRCSAFGSNEPVTLTFEPALSCELMIVRGWRVRCSGDGSTLSTWDERAAWYSHGKYILERYYTCDLLDLCGGSTIYLCSLVPSAFDRTIEVTCEVRAEGEVLGEDKTTLIFDSVVED